MDILEFFDEKTVFVIIRVLLIIGFGVIATTMIKSIISRSKTKEGIAEWNAHKKYIPYNAIAAFVADFFDVLGVGSFAIYSTFYKFRKSVDDLKLPGTLNAGNAIPVCVEAFLMISVVNVDPLTLVCTIGAAVIGSNIGARFVMLLNRTKVRYCMFVGLFIVGCVMICKQLNVGPFGYVGTDIGLEGIKLIVATVMCAIFGALMNIGVGMYAPTMALVLFLGMDVKAAFPIMIGSCALLMTFGNGPKFIQEKSYDICAAPTMTIFGTLGSLFSFFFVYDILKNNINVLIWIICGVIFLTAFLFLQDALKDSKNNKAKQA